MIKLFKVGAAVFTSAGRLYLSAVGIGHELSAVADAQNRIFAADVAQVDLEGFFVINGERATRKNDAYYRNRC